MPSSNEHQIKFYVLTRTTQTIIHRIQYPVSPTIQIISRTLHLNRMPSTSLSFDVGYRYRVGVTCYTYMDLSNRLQMKS